MNVKVMYQPLKHPQTASLDHCMQNFAADNQWLFFIDVDEFVAFPQGWDVRLVLAELQLKWMKKKNDAFCVGWNSLAPREPWSDQRHVKPPGVLLTEIIHHHPIGMPNLRLGKLAAFTDNSERLVKECHFECLKDHFCHNCLAESRNVTVLDATGAPILDYRCISEKLEKSNQVLTVYHFFTRTCYEWVHELIPKRRAWHNQRSIPSRGFRADPKFCVNAARYRSEEAPFLKRFVPQLTKRVEAHPLWRQPIQFPIN